MKAGIASLLCHICHFSPSISVNYFPFFLFFIHTCRTLLTDLRSTPMAYGCFQHLIIDHALLQFSIFFFPFPVFSLFIDTYFPSFPFPFFLFLFF